MKVKTKSEKTVTLTLSEKEARLLAALVDFPLIDAQKPEVAAFLTELWDALGDMDAYWTAEDAGFVNQTSL